MLSNVSPKTADPQIRGALIDAAARLLVEEGQAADQFVVVVHGKVNRIGPGHYDERMLLAVEADGNFFGDYGRSLRIPNTWKDGDDWEVNYIGHPIHGAAAGFIWLDHEDGAHDPDLGFYSIATFTSPRWGGAMSTSVTFRGWP